MGRWRNKPTDLQRAVLLAAKEGASRLLENLARQNRARRLDE